METLVYFMLGFIIGDFGWSTYYRIKTGLRLNEIELKLKIDQD